MTSSFTPASPSSAKKNHFYLILMLGALTALSPFSIDMYLPAFPRMAHAFGTNVARMSLSLSSYFIGLAAGQLFYGPLLDRFGRKRPLYAGLALYVLATIACFLSASVEMLVTFRFFQALGGCVAGVGAMAMVRDLFDPRESARVLALLILILGASPLLAPSIGGYLSTAFGWQAVFLVLAAMGLALLAVTVFFLPESHQPDLSQSLCPGPIFRNYLLILKEPQFYTYALAGALAFSVLFVYLASSPTIFMEIFGVSERAYGGIFAVIAAGFILTSQLNVLLLKKYGNEQILRFGIFSLLMLSLIFLAGTYFGLFGLASTVVLLFSMLSCMGLANPNTVALAMAPFARNAGSAAALLGFLQMSLGSLISVCVSALGAQQLFPIAGIFTLAALSSLTVLLVGARHIRRKVEVSASGEEAAVLAAH